MVCKKCGLKKDVSEFYDGRKKCKDCRKQQVADNRRSKWDEKYKEQNDSYRNPWQIKEWRSKTRSELVEAYGGQCACCGEPEEVFLAFDHINNDGSKQRADGKVADTFLRYLRDERPDDIQLLCFNCNWAKHKLGVCPHQRLV